MKSRNEIKAREMLEHDLAEVSNSIKSSTKGSLERLVKVFASVHIAEEILGKKNSVKLDDKELQTIESVQRLQESVLAITLDEQGENNG